MKIKPSTFPIALGALCALLAVQAQAQIQNASPTQVAIKIAKPTVELTTTPEFEFSGATKKKVPRKREWLEVEIPFETKSDSSIGMVDELTFVYYVAVTAGRSGVILTDQFSYINIPDGQEMYTVFYVSPTSLARIAGAPGKFSTGDVRSVGVEVLYKGRVIYPTDPREAWWTSVTDVPRTNGTILPKEKTPFGLLWIDRHVELQQQR